MLGLSVLTFMTFFPMGATHAVLALLVLVLVLGAAANRPNFLIFLVDDLGQADLGT